MDITGFDIGALVKAICVVAKASHSDFKVKAVESDRVDSRRGISERFAVLEERLKHTDKRLDDGTL